MEGKFFDVETRANSRGQRWEFRSVCGWGLPEEWLKAFDGFEGLTGTVVFKDQARSCAAADWLMENGWSLRMGAADLHKVFA